MVAVVLVVPKLAANVNLPSSGQSKFASSSDLVWDDGRLRSWVLSTLGTNQPGSLLPFCLHSLSLHPGICVPKPIQHMVKQYSDQAHFAILRSPRNPVPQAHDVDDQHSLIF